MLMELSDRTDIAGPLPTRIDFRSVMTDIPFLLDLHFGRSFPFQLYTEAVPFCDVWFYRRLSPLQPRLQKDAVRPPKKLSEHKQPFRIHGARS